MSVLVYDCGAVENTVTAILDTESGAMIIRGNGDVDNYMNEYSPWYSEHSNITQVTVDKGITRVGSGTFYGCENLSFVEIANTVTSMGADVFQNCTSLTSIKIPKSITAIGNGTFADSGLTEVKFYGNPPTVGTDIFDGVTADIYTPEGNEEWTETAKGTVAGNGSNLTWKTFDSKPNLIEYDELDYLWSKIKKYVDNNVSVTPVLTSGTKIATITVNGVATDIYSSGGLSGTVGSSTTPIYIDNGVPTACGGSLDVDITGNAATATSCTGNAATATTATNVLQEYGTANYNRPILLSKLENITTTTAQNKNAVFSNNFYANPSTGLMYSKQMLIGKNIGLYSDADGTGESFDHLRLGNATAQGTSGAKAAYLNLYGTGTKFLGIAIGTTNTTDRRLTINSNLTADRTYTLPDANGTIARQEDVYDDSSTYRMLYGKGGTNNTWIRTTSQGIIPSQSGAAGSGHCGLGTSSWYFATAYIDNIYGKLNGNCTGSSASCTGNAATATTATNSNNSKLTHTVGNTEYPLVFGTSFVITDAQQALRIGTPTATAANCALRCKSYCAAANTQGEAYLVCGNNLAKASANNARGSIYLYGTSTAHTQIVPGNNSTSNVVITLPASTGTLALTSSNITGSSASCTGNAATATTATNATKIKSTTAANANWYSVLGVLNTATSATNNDTYRAVGNNISFRNDANAATAYSRMLLGNATASTSSASAARAGLLCLYGTNTGYANLIGPNITGGINVYMPSIAGNIPVSSDNTVRNIQKVSSLPSSPNANTLYIVA